MPCKVGCQEKKNNIDDKKKMNFERLDISQWMEVMYTSTPPLEKKKY
jgi:hypothetical protein